MSSCEVPDQPFHPWSLMFPYRSFGQSKLVQRCFQVSWFDRFKWLHYDTAMDAVFCFSCCKAVKSGKLSSQNLLFLLVVLLIGRMPQRMTL